MKLVSGTSAIKEENEQELFLKLLYHDSHNGHAIRFTLSGDKTHKKTFANKNPQKIAYKGKKFNAYASINTFKGMRRLSNEVFNYGCIYLDIDGHDLPDDVLKEELGRTRKLIADAYDGSEITPPTIIDFTGRGFGIFYILDRSIANIEKNRKIIEYLHSVREKLFKRYEELLSKAGIKLTMDAAVLDDARVARMPGTVNQSNGEVCHIIFWNNSDGKTNYCSLSEIYNGSGLDRYSRKKPQQKTQFYKYTDLKQRYFLKKRMESLEKYQESDKYICSNKRDLLCFIYYNAAKQILGHDEAAEALNNFNEKFVHPLDKAEIENIIRVTDRNKCPDHEGYYKLNNKWIMDKLSMTQEEADTCGLGASRRKIEREETKRKNEEKRKNRRERIREYALNHTEMTYTEIGEKCDVSERTVKRYLKDMGITRYTKRDNVEAGTANTAQPETEDTRTEEIVDNSADTRKGQNVPQSLGCAPLGVKGKAEGIIYKGDFSKREQKEKEGEEKQGEQERSYVSCWIDGVDRYDVNYRESKVLPFDVGSETWIQLTEEQAEDVSRMFDLQNNRKSIIYKII